jgi:hypothetical protein
VKQHNRLDLDQKEMETFLKKTPPDFTKAAAIYNKGAHSGAYARLTVTALTADLAAGGAVTQAGNAAATGKVKKAKTKGAKEVDVTYTSTCIATATSPDVSMAGCYKTTGEMTAAGSLVLGTPTAVSNKYRNLAGFSTAAGTKMAGYVTYEKFKKFYTHSDYGHRYVTAALDGSGAFAGKAEVSRVEGAKKGSAYMNVWMYVIREFEDAIKDCKSGCDKLACNDDPVHAWDEGVAFYTGSLHGTDGSGSGKMLYALANKRCENYKTCGAAGNSKSGNSQVNIEILKLFKQGQAALLAGKCQEGAGIRGITDNIIKLMTVPLVQGALRYAYKVAEQSGGDKEKAEGAVFSAAVLPLISHCNKAAATLIQKNMKIDSAAPMGDGFAKVREAFESTYSCLGITCAHVGGLVLNDGYYSGFSPCGASETTLASSTPGVALSKVLISIAAGAAALAAH